MAAFRASILHRGSLEETDRISVRDQLCALPQRSDSRTWIEHDYRYG